MNRLLAISFLFLYINSYTEFHELLRLPVLLEHYEEHREQVKDMSFLEFLIMHYKTDLSHDNQDNRLPFKDVHHAFAASSAALPLQKIMMDETTPLTEITHASAYHESNIAIHFCDIFQPPRLI